MAEIDVVQVDRQAMVDYENRSSIPLAAEFARGILRGEFDADQRVQDFARHRLAPTGDEYGRGIENAAKVALRYETADWASYDPRTIATAIRALKGSPR